MTTKNITDRHTAENIADSIKTTLNEFNITNKVVCLVIDNAANMLKAASLLSIKHLNCFAHTLQLVITDSLATPDVKYIITKAKDIVTTFKNSNVAAELLKVEQ